MSKLTDFYFKLIKLIGYVLPVLLVLLLAYNHIHLASDRCW